MSPLSDRLAALERQKRMAAERYEQRLWEMRDSLAAWSAAHGEARDFWRWRAQTAVADFRTYHLKPGRAAFDAAVARSQGR